MGYKVAVVGATGNVGREMLGILAERAFPADDVVAIASRRSQGVEVSFGEKTLKAKAIDPDAIVIDAKSGTTGAGRAAKEEQLFAEVSEGFHAYGVGHHRHMAELDQEFTLAAGREVLVSFTPHLVPMNRGILSTIYVRGSSGSQAEALHALLLKHYASEPFVHVLPFGKVPQTRHVRGSNMTFIGVAKDRAGGRAIICSALDNLVKGASGQAVQNMNLMLGFPEALGL